MFFFIFTVVLYGYVIACHSLRAGSAALADEVQASCSLRFIYS
jgi:hypothetical protein